MTTSNSTTTTSTSTTTSILQINDETKQQQQQQQQAPNHTNIINKGQDISVLYVFPKDAKRIKTWLEQEDKLNKQFRMHSLSDGRIAIPIHTTTCNTTSTSSCSSTTTPNTTLPNIIPSWIHSERIEYGLCFCPYSSSVLGNPTNHLLLFHDDPNNNKQQKHVLHTLFYQFLQSSFQQQQQQQQQQSSSSSSSFLFVLLQQLQSSTLSTASLLALLPTNLFPTHFERIGDDKTLVVPIDAWNLYKIYQWLLLLQQQQQQQQQEPTTDTNTTIIDSNHLSSLPSTTTVVFNWNVWYQQLAQLYNTKRIVRRGYISPNTPIRQSTFQILWYDPLYYTNTNTNTTNDDNDTSLLLMMKNSYNRNPDWITITEQGIRQSYNMTHIMFSRGNITEKIRFGKQLVQPKEHILDMYAGIGYFTLPALLHGHASHVVACEWNPYAIQALRYNIQDNHIDPSRITILQGDCRQVLFQQQQQQEEDAIHSVQEQSSTQSSTTTTTTTTSRSSFFTSFDRISLGLLPSSEGGWKTAVQVLKRPKGGWLHIHGNVPIQEVDLWGKWMCMQLQQYCKDDDWWIVLVHIQKVKSFAPTINHYVADVCLGPPDQILMQQPQLQSKKEFLKSFKTPFAFRWYLQTEMVEIYQEPVIVPSCALSDTGVLHQTWMRERERTQSE